MKKQLEIINRVQHREVELGMNVELALIDDLKKAIQSAGGLSNKWQSEFFKLVSLKNSILETGQKYIAEIDKAEKVKQKAVKQMTDLGLSTKDLPEISRIDEISQDVDPLLVGQVLKTVENIKTTK